MNSKTINLFNFNYPDIKLDNRNVKVGTFFSGIGSPEMAFKRLKENGIIKKVLPKVSGKPTNMVGIYPTFYFTISVILIFY